MVINLSLVGENILEHMYKIKKEENHLHFNSYKSSWIITIF